MDTPHGQAMRTLSMPNCDSDKPAIEVPYISIGAALSWLVAKVPWLWPVFVELANRTRELHLVMYQDGAATGQLLTFDPAKSLELWYVTIEELGVERTCICDWWITLCIVRARVLKQIRGGVSAMTAALMLQLRDMKNGICIFQIQDGCSNEYNSSFNIKLLPTFIPL